VTAPRFPRDLYGSVGSTRRLAAIYTRCCVTGESTQHAGDFRFEVALSFASDGKRDKVRELARLLRDELGDGRVFFDEWFEAELAGPDAQVVLQDYYGRASRLVVVCVCRRYGEKPWTQEEWRAIQSLERGLRDAGSGNLRRMRFLPLRFGDGDVDGLFDTAIVPDVRHRTAREIADLILKRLLLAQGDRASQQPLIDDCLRSIDGLAAACDGTSASFNDVKGLKESKKVETVVTIAARPAAALWGLGAPSSSSPRDISSPKKCRLTIVVVGDKGKVIAAISKVTGDLAEVAQDVNLRVEEIEDGSVRLVVSTTETGRTLLKEAFAAGDMAEVAGFKIVSVEDEEGASAAARRRPARRGSRGTSRLRDLKTGTEVPLAAHTVIGRSRSCQMQIDLGEVSGFHAEINWDGRAWYLRDLGSRSGTFVARERISPGEPVALTPDTEIGFGTIENQYQFVEGSPPRLMAFSQGEVLVAEAEMLSLPFSGEPAANVFRDNNDRWMLETPETTRPISDEEIVVVGGRSYSVHLPRGVIATAAVEPPRNEVLDEWVLEFLVSRDSEHVDLLLRQGVHVRTIESGAHALLLLVLARVRLADAAAGVLPEPERGWMHREDLMKALAISDSQLLNLWVFRARRQFAEMKVPGGSNVVELRESAGQLRLGYGRLRIVDA
jgi:hypothetical protein